MIRQAMLAVAVVAGAILANTAQAQGAFDMGALTNTLSQDAARRQAQKQSRSGVASPGNATAAGKAAQVARVRATCANARHAADEGQQGAKMQQLLTLCARAGF